MIPISRMFRAAQGRQRYTLYDSESCIYLFEAVLKLFELVRRHEPALIDLLTSAIYLSQ